MYSTQVHTDTHTHFLCLLLLHFPVAPQWLSGDILQWLCVWPLVGAVRLHVWEKKRKRDRWYLPGWCVWPVRRTNKSDTSLEMRALSVSGETGKKKKRKSGQLRFYHTRTSCPDILFVKSLQLKSLKTNMARCALVKYPLEDRTVTLESSTDSTCGNANNFQKP